MKKIGLTYEEWIKKQKLIEIIIKPLGNGENFVCENYKIMEEK